MKRITTLTALEELKNELNINDNWNNLAVNDINIKFFGDIFEAGHPWGQEQVMQSFNINRYALIFSKGKAVAEINIAELFAMALPTEMKKAEATQMNPIFHTPELLEWIMHELAISSELSSNITIEDATHSTAIVHNNTNFLPAQEKTYLLLLNDSEDVIKMVGNKGDFIYTICMDPADAYQEVKETIFNNLGSTDTPGFFDIITEVERVHNSRYEVDSAENIFREAMDSAGSDVDWKDVNEELGFDVDNILFENVRERHDEKQDHTQLEVAETHLDVTPQSLFNEIESDMSGEDAVEIAKLLLEPGKIATDVLEAAKKYGE